MKKYISSFVIALLLHVGIFWIPMETIEENMDEEMLISIQMMNEEQEKKPSPPKKSLPPPPTPPVKKKVVKPKEVVPEKEEVAEEEVIVKKKVEPIQEVKQKVPKKTDSKSTQKQNTELTVVDASTLDNANFKPFGNKKPVYPTLARKAGIEGWVKVKVLVNEKGKVIQHKVVDYSGHPSFKQATMDVAAKWRFPIPTSSRKRVRAWFTKKISFVLN